MIIRGRSLLLMLGLTLGGCLFIDDFDSLEAKSKTNRNGSKDGGTSGADGGTGDGAVVDPDASTVDCTKAEDGTTCGVVEGFVCLSGRCMASGCGDGFVDEERGEQCEPTPLMTDGCNPETCRFPCQGASDCDDGQVCNGEERCDDATHLCVAGSAAKDDTMCTLSEGGLGLCQEGTCAPTSCGNGALDQGEDCDPSVAPENGCVGCRWECTDDQGCADGDACNGTETCVDHACVDGTVPSCDDGDNCTADSCAAEVGCVHTFIDLDQDGYAPYACTTPGLNGGDCADDDPERNPGRSEQCDGIDNDCKDGVDNDVQTAPCYPDADGDGFPVQTGATAPKCKCDAGTMFARKDGKWDCYDSSNGGASAFPGQTKYFTAGYCKPVDCPKGQFCLCQRTWDYNCDGSSSQQFSTTAGTCGLKAVGQLLLCGGSGWSDGSVPGCGVKEDYQTCSSQAALGCSGSTSEKQQACR